MNRAATMVLTLVLLVIGAITVYSFPLNPVAIILGMSLLAVSILSMALQIYFPPKTRHVVLRVVEPAQMKTESIKSRKVKKAKKKVRKITKTKAKVKPKRKAKKPKKTGKTVKRRRKR